MNLSILENILPVARPPWSGVGKQLESMCRKAIYEYELLKGVDKLAIALSGGKDSLALLFLLHSIKGRGVTDFEITAIHVSGEFSCGAGVAENFLRAICRELGVPFICVESEQKRDSLECYSCSRERRRLIFDAAKRAGATTIAFGHHRDDSVQTLVMNLLHKGEFAANLPKVPMHDYGVAIIRPLIFVPESLIVTFAKQHNFLRAVCGCPVGQESMRKKAKDLIKMMEDHFPNASDNLAQASREYGSEKALKK